MIYNVEKETMNTQDKEKLQLERLQKTVQVVYENVPFYKEKFAENNITPEQIRSLEDLKKLPFTKKQDLRDHYPFGLFAVNQKDMVRVHASSGTSGKPTVVGYTKGDIEVWSEVVARAIAAAGGEPGNVLHNAYGYGLFTGGLGLHYGSEQLGMVTVPISGGNTARQILLIQDFQPQVICGTPSYVLNIAETMEKMGKDPRQTSLKYGIFGAEPWSEEMRQTLEKKLDIKAIDIYGLSEIMGPGVSIECHEAQDGLHIADDHFYVEVIDPETLEPVKDEEYGELVFTSLTKEAFPIIRYRTGDIAAIDRTTCKCGRTSVRMSRVKGRIDDMLIIRGVNVFPSEIENCLLQVEELVPHYQILLKKKGTMDLIELQVEVNESTLKKCGGDMKHLDMDELKRRIEYQIKSNCLVSIHVQIMEPNSIPRSEGKAVRIVDLREEKVLQKK
ncbi:phenylacetate--CoA ligase PaaK [Alkalihalobacillus sp. TS-13]|uniref:phenylacetate--CoA ligase PaaK n=1 Tax=Alkalihalobacillus sp. TS-13 TaxID=2842455 RepID=UPI001C883920|nr:phenylacetate--CoA ligase PaaK [Alkalihalobacillus sp. TS-13]